MFISCRHSTFLYFSFGENVSTFYMKKTNYIFNYLVFIIADFSLINICNLLGINLVLYLNQNCQTKMYNVKYF